jgi:hypothetical protein
MQKSSDRGFDWAGRPVAIDAHPVARKCLSVSQGQVVPSGSYFDDRFHDSDVAYKGCFPEEEQSDFPSCRLRYWTLGEIVTAFARAGMIVEELLELPHAQLGDIPGLFVLTASKPQ